LLFLPLLRDRLNSREEICEHASIESGARFFWHGCPVEKDDGNQGDQIGRIFRPNVQFF
jgi:hypothetical protein